MQTLSNDLTRLLLNTSESLGMGERVKVVDKYSQKMFNSGFKLEQVRKSLSFQTTAYLQQNVIAKTPPMLYLWPQMRRYWVNYYYC